MTRREKIMIGMAGVAAIAAVVILLLPSGASRPVTAVGAPGSVSSSLAGATGAAGLAGGLPPGAEAPGPIVEQARKTLAEAVITPSQLYVLDAAVRQAAPNPFHPVQGKGDGAGGAGPDGKGGKSAAHDIAYTGYVAIGNSVLAILDGLEYRAGETVADTGYVVKSITPGKVVLASPGDVTDREIAYSGDDL
ncbi:hypothetical protein [Nitratidesulfovibrio sp. 1201_IL3209]|uniref:hypothetical protein n=1 Tax=Nitratidesulfovibrio sp. 1201_IL3209 TaxID=3084053 RepID=UPI002FDA114D